ncbi:hypothetical protein GBAR_LOCUS13829 [Geodia barretti]|uniref:Uncharacterized protein n=1 Tax=Geodia barretti TaxID=519541 RepID=A0AA35S870_GEOBA|nr:hypothetical protein GBAR_LOCUS13829 [Geodia barretti]
MDRDWRYQGELQWEQSSVDLQTQCHSQIQFR